MDRHDVEKRAPVTALRLVVESIPRHTSSAHGDPSRRNAVEGRPEPLYHADGLAEDISEAPVLARLTSGHLPLTTRATVPAH
jgi:hypothetical protein